MQKILYLIKSLIDFTHIVLIRREVIPSFTQSNSILFINSGQIGDLVITSRLVENDLIFDNYNEVYLLIRDEYKDLFSEYQGSVKILTYKNDKFRYNILYRTKLFEILNELKVKEIFNLTSARPTWNDLLALGIKAEKVYCFTNSWKKLKKVFGQLTDSYYSRVFNYPDNEYERIRKLIEYYRNNNRSHDIKSCLFIPKKSFEIRKNDIIISPFTSLKIKNWNVEKFKKLITKLANEYSILLVGSRQQEGALLELKNHNHSVSISAGTFKLTSLYNELLNARLFIGLDSGISHLAIKAKVKAIILLGGGTYGKYFPIPSDNQTMYLSNTLQCFNCEWECSRNGNFCLSEIEIHKVYSLAKSIL